MNSKVITLTYLYLKKYRADFEKVKYWDHAMQLNHLFKWNNKRAVFHGYANILFNKNLST